MTFSDVISSVGRYLHRTNDYEISQMAGLAEGTASATIKTTIAFVYSLYNVQYSKPATDSIAMTACAQQAAGTYCYYLVSVNAAGAVITTKGTDSTLALPTTPSGSVAFGAFKVTTVAVTFTSGTTDLSASGVTTVFYDIDTGIASSLINQAMRQLERGVTIVHNGRQRTIDNFDHMKVRETATLADGATTVTLSLPRFKCFADNGVTLTSASGQASRLEKDDTVPLDTSTEQRPTIISRLPTTESSFSPDIAPAMTFSVWPKCEQAYTLNAIAYQYSPDLDGVIYATNWLTENAPDVLLFGALVESSSYFPAPDTRVEEWRRRWNDAVWTLYLGQEKSKSTGSYLHTKFFNPLNDGGYDEQSINNG